MTNVTEQPRCKGPVLIEGNSCILCKHCTSHTESEPHTYTCKQLIRGAYSQEEAMTYTCPSFLLWASADILPEGYDAIKNDAGKVQMHMIPTSPLEQIARVYMAGAEKYGKDNWKMGMDWSRIYDAVQRHLMAFWRGEDNDKEDNLSHLAHAAWGMFTLMEYQRTGTGKDNRYNG